MNNELSSLPDIVGPTLPSTRDKREFLMSSQAWAGQGGEVGLVETHMSWIFLTDEHAWKLKKPVCCDFLDFRSVSARQEYCDEELRLNRRLAPEIYQETVPLTVDVHGAMHVGGPGRPVDWLVKMKRLPSERMLDAAIRDGTVDALELEAIGRMLASFFVETMPVVMPPNEYRRRFADRITGYRRVLSQTKYGLPVRTIEKVTATLRKTLMGHGPLFDKRIRRGRVREGHGDLRAEHIYLGPPPAVIDSLEFNRDFRLQDVVDELSFLALECEFHGSPGVGKVILEACCESMRDQPPAELIAFYKAFRAMMRAYLSILHMDDEEQAEPERWKEKASTYLALAQRYAGELS